MDLKFVNFYRSPLFPIFKMKCQEKKQRHLLIVLISDENCKMLEEKERKNRKVMKEKEKKKNVFYKKEIGRKKKLNLNDLKRLARERTKSNSN